MERLEIQRRSMFNAIGMGNAEIVRECLEAGVDANARTPKGRTPLIKAVRTLVVESVVVDVLLDHGADPRLTDGEGHTALDYARRRLERLGPGPDKISKSRSLDEHGNLRLTSEETQRVEQFAAELRESDAQLAEEYLDIYMQERRKAAVRQFMPRRELRIIIQRLEEVLGDWAAK